MDTMTLLDYAEKEKILLGVCDNTPLTYLTGNISLDTPFVSNDFDKRINPLKIFDKTKSIIVVGIPYSKKICNKNDNEKRGLFSMSAVGLDYHIIVKEKLQELAKFISTYTNFEYKSYVDSPFLFEKELGKKSGIGFQGKNLLLISEKYGSYFFIGYLLTNLSLNTTKSIEFKYNKCGSCNLCQKSCPTKAINKDFYLDVNKCISYITQKKDDIAYYLAVKMNNYLYGCDICQMVCPFNKIVDKNYIDDINIIKPNLVWLKNLSKNEFKKIYGQTSIYWRGKKIIDRNIDIILSNYKK